MVRRGQKARMVCAVQIVRDKGHGVTRLCGTMEREWNHAESARDSHLIPATEAQLVDDGTHKLALINAHLCLYDALLLFTLLLLPLPVLIEHTPARMREVRAEGTQTNGEGGGLRDGADGRRLRPAAARAGGKP